MSKMRNIQRFWLDWYDGCILRTWRLEEYTTINPDLPFREKWFVTVCLCGYRSAHTNKADACHAGKVHHRHCRRVCFVKKRPIDLVCYEVREVYHDKYDVWTHETKIYRKLRGE